MDSKERRFALYATTFGRTATVMRKRGDVFDRFDRETGLLKGGNRTIATAPWAFNLDVDLFHSELHRLIGTLLGGHLASKGGAFAASLEIYSPGGRPTKGVPLYVGDSNGRIIERRFDMRDTGCNIPTDFFTFGCFCHL